MNFVTQLIGQKILRNHSIGADDDKNHHGHLNQYQKLE
jgi:hypothetical protein